MKLLRRQLTYANVVSTLCLFLLLGGGTALAASSLAKNSVGSKQIKKNAITTAKIKNGAVTGPKIAISTLGTVPSATHAISADTATSANTAGTANEATTLQGLTPTQIVAASKLHCPTGTTMSAGTCMETAVRPAAGLLTALATCAKASMVLPSMTELDL